jgi:hypothetical protein
MRKTGSGSERFLRAGSLDGCAFGPRLKARIEAELVPAKVAKMTHPSAKENGDFAEAQPDCFQLWSHDEIRYFEKWPNKEVVKKEAGQPCRGDSEEQDYAAERHQQTGGVSEGRPAWKRDWYRLPEEGKVASTRASIPRPMSPRAKAVRAGYSCPFMHSSVSSYRRLCRR